VPSSLLLRADEVINRGFGLPLHKRDTSTAILYRNYLTGELYAGSTYLQDRLRAARRRLKIEPLNLTCILRSIRKGKQRTGIRFVRRTMAGITTKAAAAAMMLLRVKWPT
jgi:hypothetical protein